MVENCVLTMISRRLAHLQHENRRRERAARVEVDVKDMVGLRLLRQALAYHLVQSLLLRLRLAGEVGGTVAEACDVFLHMADLHTCATEICIRVV